jgi:hypothetical protein
MLDTFLSIGIIGILALDIYWTIKDNKDKQRILRILREKDNHD